MTIRNYRLFLTLCGVWHYYWMCANEHNGGSITCNSNAFFDNAMQCTYFMRELAHQSHRLNMCTQWEKTCKHMGEIATNVKRITCILRMLCKSIIACNAGTWTNQYARVKVDSHRGCKQYSHRGCKQYSHWGCKQICRGGCTQKYHWGYNVMY